MKVATFTLLLLWWLSSVLNAGHFMKPPRTPDRWKVQTIQRLVNEHAWAYEIDIDRWYTLIDLESNWDRFALSPKNASGICQIMPATARAYGVIGDTEFIIEALQDPLINIPVCAMILRDLLKRYSGDWFSVAVAFNAGPSVVSYAQKISRGQGLALNESTR